MPFTLDDLANTLAGASVTDVEDRMSVLTPEDHESLKGELRKYVDARSYWVNRLNITPCIRSPNRWEKDWEKALRTLSNDDTVFPITMKLVLEAGKRDPQHASRLKMTTSVLQREAAKMVAKMLNEGQLETIWMLLEASEQKRYVQTAIEGAAAASLVSLDARVLCPDISASRLTKEQGRALITYCRQFLDAEDAATRLPFSVPNEWWEQLSDRVRSGDETLRDACDYLTVVRNEFVAAFIKFLVECIQADIRFSRGGVQTALETMETVDKRLVQHMTDCLKTVRDKPLIRCENCTRDSDELGSSTRFMACGVCREKLGFKLYYCSRECQKADWPNHKLHCGKEKVSKGLPGTATDPWWAAPSNAPMDWIRDLPTNSNGNISISDIDTGAVAYPRSSALRRQVTMLEANKEVDYFLHNFRGELVPFQIEDGIAKMHFRLLRRAAMSTKDQEGVAQIADYLITHSVDLPGVSRRLILKQFDQEYGKDTTRKIMIAEKYTQREGITFIDRNCNTTLALGPRFFSASE